MWLNPEERVTLTIVGALALAGLVVLLWQRQRPPLTVSAAPVPMVQWDTALDASRRVDINTAGAAELERLPQVGPALAGRIVAYRTEHGSFRSLDDLSRVAGIGPKTIEAIREYLTIQ